MSNDSEDFQKAIEGMVAKAGPMPDPEDLRIISYMQVTARSIAEHDRAIDPLTREADNVIYALATLRRSHEAELNKLINERMKKLVLLARANMA